jgi:phosphatidylinositol alpha-1,6-mannosyltransferase
LLLIVGDAPHQALRAQAQTPKSIQAAADAAGVGEHIRFLGKVADDELSELYRVADVHVFPVRAMAADPEGFGMVALEAAARGLPTVAFANGGVTDAVAEGVSGRLVTAGDYGAFAGTVLKTLTERESLRGLCFNFARQFEWPAFGTGILEQLIAIEHGSWLSRAS